MTDDEQELIAFSDGPGGGWAVYGHPDDALWVRPSPDGWYIERPDGDAGPYATWEDTSAALDVLHALRTANRAP